MSVKDDAANKANDFVDAINDAARKESLFVEEIPPPFPEYNLSAKERNNTDPRQTPSMDFDPKDWKSHYVRYDMGDPDDVALAEEVNDGVFEGTHIVAREEWVHTKEGSSFILMKYLTKKKKPPSKKTPDDTE